MPEKPIPEQDPITGKSYAIHYLIATVILIATLFWALYDEAWGQRPWKAFQDHWKDRYAAFLNTAKSTSTKSEQSVEKDPQYAALKQDYEKAYQDSKAHFEWKQTAGGKHYAEAKARGYKTWGYFVDNAENRFANFAGRFDQSHADPLLDRLAFRRGCLRNGGLFYGRYLHKYLRGGAVWFDGLRHTPA